MKTTTFAVVLLCWMHPIAVLNAQEVRRAIPVEREVRKAIPLEPMQEAAVPMSHDYIYNALLPYDAIQLADEEVISDGDFYTEQPKRKPVNVPASFVLVSVFQRERGNGWADFSPTVIVRFAGWEWMDADTVNALHLDLDLVSL